MFKSSNNFMLLEKLVTSSKSNKQTLTVMITILTLHFLFMDKSFCVASSIQENVQHFNSFCDMKPNCDGDTELYERLIADGSIQQNNGNSLFNYPVKRTKRSFVPYRTGKIVASQASQTLDNLLLHSDYDKRIRPQVI